MQSRIAFALLLWLAAGTVGAAQLAEGTTATLTQYLAFQIFTGVRDSPELRAAFPAPAHDTATAVDEIIHAIGGVGDEKRKLAFIVGPLSFDNSDDDVRRVIHEGFSIAAEKDIAVGFHVDDSMFWSRLAYLNAPDNIEWLDWNRTPNTGRRVDWSPTPLQVMPQLCINSPEVEAAVKTRAALIGAAVMEGVAALQAAGKAVLFAGVIAGWETRIGRDFATGSYLGYCALTNNGYTASHPPGDPNEARADATQAFVSLWSSALADAGVPDTKIFSHTAFLARAVFDLTEFTEPGHYSATYLETVNFTPPRVGFGGRHYPGFTTYPQFGALSQIRAERERNSNPPWVSAEGTALDPSAASRGAAGVAMEPYLGNLFNHGAVVVNIFGWGVGDANNPFRRTAESATAIEAYRKFLRGEPLQEDAVEQIPSPHFFEKIRKLRADLPAYFAAKGKAAVATLYDSLSQQLDAKRFTEAEATIDAILTVIAK